MENKEPITASCEEELEIILGENEYLGEGIGGKLLVKVSLDGDKIAKYEALSQVKIINFKF